MCVTVTVVCVGSHQQPLLPQLEQSLVHAGAGSRGVAPCVSANPIGAASSAPAGPHVRQMVHRAFTRNGTEATTRACGKPPMAHPVLVFVRTGCRVVPPGVIIGGDSIGTTTHDLHRTPGSYHHTQRHRRSSAVAAECCAFIYTTFTWTHQDDPCTTLTVPCAGCSSSQYRRHICSREHCLPNCGPGRAILGRGSCSHGGRGCRHASWTIGSAPGAGVDGCVYRTGPAC